MLVCGIIFLIVGVLLFFFKADWLIAGYNTMSEKEKRDKGLDSKDLSKKLGIVNLIVGLVLCVISWFAHI